MIRYVYVVTENDRGVSIMLKTSREKDREIQIWIRRITVCREHATEKKFRVRNFKKGERNVTSLT